MNRSEARKAAEVMLAYADGKEIEFKTNGTGKWLEANEPSFDWQNNADRFRVKPEPKYRPFKDAEECWQEMQKHQPFGWVKRKGMYYMQFTYITDRKSGNLTYDTCFDEFIFADGTPFGMLEESV